MKRVIISITLLALATFISDSLLYLGVLGIIPIVIVYGAAIYVITKVWSRYDPEPNTGGTEVSNKKELDDLASKSKN